MLIRKTMLAATRTGLHTVVLGGGVAANTGAADGGSTASVSGGAYSSMQHRWPIALTTRP